MSKAFFFTDENIKVKKENKFLYILHEVDLFCVDVRKIWKELRSIVRIEKSLCKEKHLWEEINK